MQRLQQILRDKLIPWARSGAAERIIVARPRMSAATVPGGVQVTQRKIPGKRVIVKHSRFYGNTRSVSAKWPESGMHETANHRFICVVEGNVNFQAGNYLLGCHEGDFILIPSGVPYHGNGEYLPHLISSDIPGKICWLLWMELYPRGFRCWLSGYKDDRREMPATENYLLLNEQIIQLFELLTDEVLGEKENAICDNLLATFMAFLNREVKAEHYLHPNPLVKPEPVAASGSDFIQRLEHYIEQHLDKHLVLDDVARQLYMSRTHFVRRIRQETSQTFVEFLTTYRIKEAKILLSESEWTVQTIAQFVGLKSPTYFHALFQREVGCTPNEFRHKTHKS